MGFLLNIGVIHMLNQFRCKNTGILIHPIVIQTPHRRIGCRKPNTATPIPAIGLIIIVTSGQGQERGLCVQSFGIMQLFNKLLSLFFRCDFRSQRPIGRNGHDLIEITRVAIDIIVELIQLIPVIPVNGLFFIFVPFFPELLVYNIPQQGKQLGNHLG